MNKIEIFIKWIIDKLKKNYYNFFYHSDLNNGLFKSK